MRRTPAVAMVVTAGLVAGAAGFATAAATWDTTVTPVAEPVPTEDDSGDSPDGSMPPRDPSSEPSEAPDGTTDITATASPRTTTTAAPEPTATSSGPDPEAPIDVSGGPVWISVASSLSTLDFVRADAVQRRDRVARATSEVPGILLSDRYPSLNPDLWVVYLGPFLSEDEAARACAGLSPCYPRIVSNDADDRYCLADDGCAGERRTDR